MVAVVRRGGGGGGDELMMMKMMMNLIVGCQGVRVQRFPLVGGGGKLQIFLGRGQSSNCLKLQG
ncbi:hypothetical protein HanIR_Chr13g0617121 [Helianthus annuus]|nr:hypothetical protein HanIR_Chr13g0617121 [Helianthus annuus]